MPVQTKAELQTNQTAAYPVTEINKETLESALISDLIDTVIPNQIFKTADYMLDPANATGLTFVSTLDGIFALPQAIQIGSTFTIMNMAEDGEAQLNISPIGADSITFKGDATDNKDLINTKATQKKGDFVTLASLDGVVSWQVVAIRGIWAKEP